MHEFKDHETYHSKSIQGHYVREGYNAKEFLEEIEKRFAKNKKTKTSTFLENLISMRYKGKGNIQECIMEMSHITSK